MLIINPGSHVKGGTEAQAYENARRWLSDMRENGITDPAIVLLQIPRHHHAGRWTFVFLHTGTGVECALEIHGLTDAERDAYTFPPRVYWKGSSCSTPDPLDWMAPGHVLAIIPAEGK